MSRRTKLIGGGVLIGAIVLAAGAWIALRLLAGPLAGHWRHDFGEVLVPREGITLQHTFALRNRSGEVVRIEDVRPSCGCASVELSTPEIPPGQVVNVTVDFSLKGAGKKHANVELRLSGDRMKRLTVVATRVPQ